ncbi:uncharacterized protein ACNLHF_017606 isoform 1-T1 [Anomaloglossus baeobatrachus]
MSESSCDKSWLEKLLSRSGPDQKRQINKGYYMREIAKKLKISYNGVYYSLQRRAQTSSNQSRKRSGRPCCTTEQQDKYIRVKYIRVSSLRNQRLTGPQLAASLNSTRKTPV